MHFLIHRDLKANPMIRWLLVGYTFAIMAFVILSPWFEGRSLGLFPSEVMDKLLGNPDKYISAMNRADVAIALHTKLFFNGLVAVVLASMALRTHVADGWKKLSLFGLFMLPLFEVFTVVLVLLKFPGAVYLKSLTFAAIWLTQFNASLGLLFHLMSRRQNGH